MTPNKLPLDGGLLPKGVSGHVLVWTDGTAELALFRNGRHAVATIAQPLSAHSINKAANAALTALDRAPGHVDLGMAVTRIDRDTGEFWINGDVGPFKMPGRVT